MQLHLFQNRGTVGVHYAVRIFIGTAAVWLLLGANRDINPLWAVISLIAVTEPEMKTAWTSFLSRLINTLIGCSIGLIFLCFFGTQSWLLPVASTVTVIICTCLMQVSQGWRVAPTTTALVMSAGLIDNSTQGAIFVALHRTLGVLVGSIMALLVTWVMARLWIPVDTAKEQEKHGM